MYRKNINKKEEEEEENSHKIKVMEWKRYEAGEGLRNGLGVSECESRYVHKKFCSVIIYVVFDANALSPFETSIMLLFGEQYGSKF